MCCGSRVYLYPPVDFLHKRCTRTRRIDLVSLQVYRVRRAKGLLHRTYMTRTVNRGAVVPYKPGQTGSRKSGGSGTTSALHGNIAVSRVKRKERVN